MWTEYPYWDDGVLINPYEGMGKVWSSIGPMGLVLAGRRQLGPDIPHEISVDLGREVFGPTQPPTDFERLPWLLASLDADRASLVERLLDEYQ